MKAASPIRPLRLLSLGAPQDQSDWRERYRQIWYHRCSTGRHQCDHRCAASTRHRPYRHARDAEPRVASDTECEGGRPGQERGLMSIGYGSGSSVFLVEDHENPFRCRFLNVQRRAVAFPFHRRSFRRSTRERATLSPPFKLKSHFGPGWDVDNETGTARRRPRSLGRAH